MLTLEDIFGDIVEDDKASSDHDSTDGSQTEQTSPPLSDANSSLSSIDIDAFLGEEYHPPSPPSLKTYRIVGDNIDKEIKPRNMTSEHQKQGLHYFHMYAVRDRVDLSGYSSEAPKPDIGTMDLETLLPSHDDERALQENFVFLTGRVLKKYMPFFKKFGAGLGRHIQHEHVIAMATKSEVVCRNCMQVMSIPYVLYRLPWVSY